MKESHREQRGLPALETLMQDHRLAAEQPIANRVVEMPRPELIVERTAAI